jgi:alpha-L-rhamnosidase
MGSFKKATLILFALLGMVHFSKAAAVLKTGQLTCEYLNNPLGIGVNSPRLSWTLTSDGRNQSQSAYELVVSDNEAEIKKNQGNMWTTGKVMTDQSLHIAYAGKSLQSFTRYYWRVRVYDQNGVASGWSAPQWFETALLSTNDWQGQWIGDGSKLPEQEADFYKDDRAPLFRKTFKTKGKVTAARLYISGIGYNEAYINGKKVGDHMLDPGWTGYQQQVLYTIYDVTKDIRNGENAAGIMLGNGWYNAFPLRFWGSKNLSASLTTGRPCVKAMLRVTYDNGTSEVIATDESWQTIPGPVVRNNVYLGEHYDARLETNGWSTISPVAANWQSAVAVTGPAGTLTPQMQPPIRVTRVVKPVGVVSTKPGVYVFDMGQNFAGVVRLRVKGAAGTKVTVRYGEDKYPDGNVNVMTAVAGQIKNNNGGPGTPAIAWQEDSYTLKGTGAVETWAPRFTFHGFRYVEVTGWPGTPTLENMEGLRMNSDLQEDGAFTSSNTMFNKLDKTIQWTFLSNVFSVQSDCPAREKLAYGGDILCTSEAFLYHYHMPQFYSKTIRDHANAQRPLGGITETAPFVGIADSSPGDKSGPVAYQALYPYLVKKVYEFYGDKRLIEENYADLTKLMKFLEGTAKDYLHVKDLGDHESLDEKAIPLAASVFFMEQAKMMSEFAGVLDRNDDKTYYAALAENIRQAIVAKFEDKATGKFEKGTQSAQLYALWSQVLKAGDDAKAVEALVAAFEQRDWHVSTGIFGTKMLFDVLREKNKNDMAYRIANQRTYPGWGHMIENGATTLWETWKESDNVYSKNHPMFGSVSEWFYRSLLGINSAAPGFKKIRIKPQPAGDLTYAKGSYKSVYGTIVSDWAIKGNAFSLKVTIPVNTSAEVWVPVTSQGVVNEGGVNAQRVKGIRLLKTENGYAVYEVGSGNYNFTTAYNK